MSVKLRFEFPADGGGGMVQRSRSFTSYGSVSGRRRASSMRGSVRSKGLSSSSSKSPRMALAHRISSNIWGQQPEQVDHIFQALRKGLKEYLECHQMELDFLSNQQRDTKRNSRLAFLYDLEKEIRALERYNRRLEFHISKVEELYESYCIQWRLCKGAMNMKRAFSLSPSSRASRESLMELHRSHRVSLEDMCVVEGELEILLGELQIKMKGLIGFARLCPGDQYEVVIQLGHQRWRICGKIQADDRQHWDEEEMIFLPHIHENFEIKVTEVKGLGSNLVGMVTCKSADFFMARPQLMVVDITELGTIKLQLEVMWNPFDSGEVRPLVASASRLSLPSRKGSVYSWTPPNTPSFTEKYFISMVRQMREQEGEGGGGGGGGGRRGVGGGGRAGSFSLASRDSRGVSLLSYLSENSAAFERGGGGRGGRGSSVHTPTDDDEMTRSFPEEEGGDEGDDGDDDSVWRSEPNDASTPSPGDSRRDSMLLFQRSSSLVDNRIRRYSTPDILRQNGGGVPSCPSGLLETDLESSLNTSQDTDAESEQQHLQQQAPVTVGPVTMTPEEPHTVPVPESDPNAQDLKAAEPSPAQRRAVAQRISTLLAALETALGEEKEKGGRTHTESQLTVLGKQVQHLNTVLKRDLGVFKTSSTETLAVEEEEVLGSFDFLSTDFSVEDSISCMGSVRLRDTGISSFKETTLRSLGLLPQEGPPPPPPHTEPESRAGAPLSTGSYALDQSLETHLAITAVLLRALRGSDSELVLREIAEELSRQLEVLDKMGKLALGGADDFSLQDIVPASTKHRSLRALWEECCGREAPFCCPADAFSKSLRKRFIHKVKAKQPGQSDAVFVQLLLQIQSCCRMLPTVLCSADRVTVFQFFSYLSRWAITDFGEHISRLSKEVYLQSSLESPKRRRALKKVRGRRVGELLPLGSTLRLLATLQTDANHKVAHAASSCLTRLAAVKPLRAKALVYYTEVLKDSDIRVQRAACLALKCLKATESAEQVADLWRLTDEDLRNAAKETVLSFGKKGYAAFQRMERICSEMQEDVYKNLETEITIL
ncbi:RIPOR family member 3 [Engraulis encrasicolus]|uniref:RIPOR family member 3 n=1 Tax=Engraulis encrasicolus TaxID=184585 RepID=UPI002FCE79D8